MLQDFKPEIKIFLIVAAVAVAATAGGVFLLRMVDPPDPERPRGSEESIQGEGSASKNEQSVVDVNDWRAYHNEEYGFRLEYPAHWSVETEYLDENLPSFTLRNQETRSSFIFYPRGILYSPVSEQQISTRKSMIDGNAVQTILYGSLDGDIVAEVVQFANGSSLLLNISVEERVYEEEGPYAPLAQATPNQNDAQALRKILDSFQFTGSETDDSLYGGDWPLYRNEELGFQINYPPRHHIPSTLPLVFRNCVGFCPDPSRWGINIFEKASTSIEEIASRIGNQWQGRGRQEDREKIQVGDLEATKITVTTSEYPEWISESIVLEGAQQFFVLGNGAVKDPEFDIFVRSFRFLGEER